MLISVSHAFQSYLIQEGPVQVSEGNDEGSYARTTGNEATTGLGRGCSQGRLCHSHRACLSRHPLHAKRLIFYVRLACKNSRVKHNSCNTKSHKSLQFSTMKTPQTPIIIAMHILCAENPHFKRKTEQHEMASRYLQYCDKYNIYPQHYFYFKLKSLVSILCSLTLHSQSSQSDIKKATGNLDSL